MTLAGACGQPAGTEAPRPDPRAVAAAITEGGLRDRLHELADATTPNPGYRAAGTPGYAAAAARVESILQTAGWTVTEDAWTDVAFVDDGSSSLEAGGRRFGVADVVPLIFAPPGTVEGPVVAIDADPHGAPGTGSGCLATHYGTLPAHAVVLVRSGPCYRRDAVLAAQQAGASAFVAVMAAGSGAVLRPTLIDPHGLEIPAAAASLPASQALAAIAAAGGTARLTTHAHTASTPSPSIIAELPGSDPASVVMLGAHLDSVVDGPGINDDGSGVAALLEIARALAGTRPVATIRLAFWSGEELGLHGSSRYVRTRSDVERQAIIAYLNADMIGSPNGFAGVYHEASPTVGSDGIHDLLAAAVRRAGGAPVDVALGASSDHWPFDQAGIAIGGVFSGASEAVTPAEAAAGGTPGLAADPCYHRACDDLRNVDLPLARILSASLGDVVTALADSPVLAGR